MRKILTRALIMGALLGGLTLAGAAPAGAAGVADVGINGCSIGPSNAGSCTVVVTEPGIYILEVDNSDGSWSGAWAGCAPIAASMSTFGTGYHYAWTYVNVGECQIGFTSPDDAATVSFYKF